MYCHVPKGTSLDYFKKLLTWETETTKNEFVQGAFDSFKEFYAAVKTTVKATGKTYTWAFVAMVNYTRGDYNFGYKNMDETCGPNISNCPKSILALLSPVEETTESRSKDGSYGWAKAWRIRCWENVFQREATNKLEDGAIIKFENPLRFTNGDSVQTFQLRKRGKAMRWYAYDVATKMISPYASYRLRKRDFGRFTILAA
jgi:hypothetical protein